MLDEDTQLAVLTAMVPDEIKEKDAENNSDEDTDMVTTLLGGMVATHEMRLRA